VPAPFAGIASATTPATAATVNAVRTVRSFVCFMYQVSLIRWEWRELRLGIVREYRGGPVLE
jgi:hypothetical protein